MKTYITNGIKHGAAVKIERVSKSGVSLARAVVKNFPGVQRVADSYQAVRIDVRDTDRAGAEPQEHTKCAFAVAACREHKADGAFIGIRASYLVFGSLAIRFCTPSTVAREITTFDRHQDFATGIYRLSPMTPSQRFGKPQNRNKNPKRRKKRNHGNLKNHFTTRVRSID
jgi:hypothetical protein